MRIASSVDLGGNVAKEFELRERIDCRVRGLRRAMGRRDWASAVRAEIANEGGHFLAQYLVLLRSDGIMDSPLVSTRADAELTGTQRDGANRVPELDALRGFGALTILGYHLWPATFFFGWTRADLFFVISGYLITRIIIRHGSNHGFLVRFWARRALRIWPAYYLMLAILYVKARAKGIAIPVSGLVSHATFTQNISYCWSPIVPYFPEAAHQTWSLAVEEQFYLVWPLVGFLIGRSTLIPASVWLVGTCLTVRLAGVYPAVAIARADGLALGTILATLDLGPGVRRSRAASTALVFAGLLGLFCLCFRPFRRSQDFVTEISGCGPLSILAVNVIYFSIVGLVLLNSGHRVLALLRWRPLCYMGQVSYGVYLYHLLVIESVERYSGDRSLTTCLIAAALSVMAGLISWECLEKPIGNLKNLFPYEPGRPTRLAAQGESTTSDERSKEATKAY